MAGSGAYGEYAIVDLMSVPTYKQVLCRLPDQKPGCTEYPHTHLCENAPLCVSKGPLEVEFWSQDSRRIRVHLRTQLPRFS